MTPLAVRIEDIWVYLAAGPLLWLTITRAAYAAADRLAAVLGRPAYANPVLFASGILVAILLATGTKYETFFAGAQFVHFLLGPATVALAVPLYRNLPKVRTALIPMLAALLCGSLTAIVSAVVIAAALGAPRAIQVSLAPKSVTTPIAMGVAEAIGGIPTLTAVLVILTGIIGAMSVTPLMNALGIRDDAARGFAAGVASHGIGTARAFQVSEIAGTFAGLGMALNGLLTAILAPMLMALWR
jgi:predicted murein hydrolase (TIGR00659 family)